MIIENKNVCLNYIKYINNVNKKKWIIICQAKTKCILN